MKKNKTPRTAETIFSSYVFAAVLINLCIVLIVAAFVVGPRWVGREERAAFTLLQGETKIAPDDSAAPSDLSTSVTDPLDKGPWQISSGDTNVVFDNGSVAVVFDEKQLLSEGFKATFTYKNVSYVSSDASWRCTTLSKRRMIVKGGWGDVPPFTVVWSIMIPHDGGIKIDVYLEEPETLNIDDCYLATMECVLDKQFITWRSVLNKGTFADDHYGPIIVEDVNTRFISVSIGQFVPFYVGLCGNEKSMANVTRIVSVPEGRRISFSTVPELADERTAHLASMDVTITKDTKKLETMHATQKRAEFERVRGALTNTMISRGSLVFFFDNGQGRLLMNGRELTNGFGLFTSFLIDRGWSSSRDAVWSTIRPRNDTLIAKGRFLNIPMQMIIIYKISDYNRLEASIAVEFFEDLSIQQMFTSLAVDNAYEEQGLRKMTFKTRKDYLPRIISFRNTDGILCTARAINEEYFAPAKGDVLSYKAIADKVLTKGMHDNFFKGEIDVDMIEPTNRR